jgi:MFS family permease
LSVLVETFGFAYIFMLPVVARDVLQVGASGLGYLSAAGSVGALAGTIVVAGLGEVRGKWSMLATASGCAGVGLLLFAVSPWFATSLVLAGAIGLALVVYDATIATLLQLVSAEALRGRILGMYGLTWGFTPLGGFIAGAVASVLSAPVAIGVGGVVIVSYTIGVLARMGGTERTLESSTSSHESEQRG